MPDYSDTIANVQSWKALPVPTEDVNLICQGQAIRITFKSSPTGGFVLQPGKAIRLKSGDTGFIKPFEALGGIAVMEVFG